MLKIIQAKQNQLKEISHIISVLDTENYNFSDKKNIKKNISKGQYFVAIEKKK